MTAAVTRTLQIVYGSVTVGGTSDYLIPGRVTLAKAYGKGSVSFNVLVQDDTAATFATKCATLEAAFRTPRQALTVTMESQTFISFDPTAGVSGNTGFHAEPSITKQGGGADTGRSRLYACSVTYDLPADLSGVSGRAYATSTIDYDAARRRRITITGRYTALAANNATAQYESAGPTYCASVVSALGSGGTFDLVDEQKIPEDQDKFCDFSRTYQEVFVGTASATLSHASIRASTIVFQRNRVGPGDSPGKNVKRLQTISARVDCFLDHTVNTDPQGLWDATIRPYMLAQIKSRFSVDTVADVTEDSAYDATENKITAQLTCSCLVSGTTTIEYRLSTKITTELGELLQPAYGGDRYHKYRFDGIAERYRQTTELETRVGTWSVSDDGASFTGGGSSGGGGSGSAAGSISLSSGGGVSSSATPFLTHTPAGTIQTNANDSIPTSGGGGGSGGGTSSGNATSGYVLVHRELDATTITLGVDQQFVVSQLVTVTIEAYYVEPSNSSEGGGGPQITPNDPSNGPYTLPVGGIPNGLR